MADNSSQRPNDLLTFPEVMAELRLAARSSVYALVHRGELHAYRVGRRTCFRRSDVEKCKFARQGLRRPRWRGRLGGGQGLAG